MTLYVRTVELGSFRATAEAMGLSPSVVSHHIKQLEKKYGVALLYRSTRKLSQTSDGKAFYEHASRMAAAAAGALDVLTGDSPSPHGRLRISIPAGIVRGEVSRKVAAFARAYPNVRISVMCTDRQVDLIAEGVDLALRTGSLKDSTLKAQRVGEIRRKLVCSRDYLSGKAMPRHPAELAQWDWIRLGMLPARRTFLHRDGERCEVAFESRIEVDSVEAMYQFVRRGLGLATPPDFLVEDDVRSGYLVALLPDWRIAPLPVFAVWPPNTTRQGLTMRFLDFLRSPAAPPEHLMQGDADRLGTAPE